MNETQPKAADPVGFIGLGLMGSKMAANLQTLIAWNRTPSTRDPLHLRGSSHNLHLRMAALDVVRYLMTTPRGARGATALSPIPRIAGTYDSAAGCPVRPSDGVCAIM